MSILDQMKIVDKIYPSDANFILVKFKDVKLVNKTLISNGIITRDRSKDVKDTLRITIGNPGENEKLLTNLTKIEDEKSIVY